MKQKLLEIIQVTVWLHHRVIGGLRPLHTDEFIFLWFYKNGNGRQNRYSGAKIELLRRLGATP